MASIPKRYTFESVNQHIDKSKNMLEKNQLKTKGGKFEF